MLQDIRRVKLINFGETKVRGQLLRNAIEESHRQQPMLRKTGWRILTPQCDLLFAHLRAIVRDWGTHLSSHLYNGALIHHFSGETHCLKRLDVKAGGENLGTHLVQVHCPDYAFAVTALTHNQTHFQNHLDTLLAHSDLRAIQWINLNHSRIEISTLQRDGKGTKV